VAYLFRYREISPSEATRGISMPWPRVDDPTEGVRALDSLTTRKNTAAARAGQALPSALSTHTQLFAALMRGEQASTDSRIATSATSSTLRRFAWTTIPASAAPRSVGSHRLHVYRLSQDPPLPPLGASPTSAGAS